MLPFELCRFSFIESWWLICSNVQSPARFVFYCLHADFILNLFIFIDPSSECQAFLSELACLPCSPSSSISLYSLLLFAFWVQIIYFFLTKFQVWATVSAYSTNVRICASYCQSMYSACGSARINDESTVATSYVSFHLTSILPSLYSFVCYCCYFSIVVAHCLFVGSRRRSFATRHSSPRGTWLFVPTTRIASLPKQVINHVKLVFFLGGWVLRDRHILMRYVWK